MKYRKNLKKKNNLIKFILILMLFIIIIWVMPTIVIENMNQQIVKQANIPNNELETGLKYNILDLIKVLQVGNSYIVNVVLNDSITYTDNIEISVNMKEYSSDFKYNIKIYLNETEILTKDLFSETEIIPIKIQNQGKNVITVQILKDDIEEYSDVITIYYIKPYEKQFLDELSNKGVQVHYRPNNKWEDYNKSIPLIKAMGAKYLRADIFYLSVNKENQHYDFTYYDNWIKEAISNGFKIILEFNGFTTKDGESIKFDTEEEFYEYETFISQVMERYSQISNFEVLNEPNFQYTSEEDVKNYSKLVELANNNSIKNEKTNIIAGALAQVSDNKGEDSLTTIEFFDKLTYFNGYKNSNAYSYHPYDGSNLIEQNPYFKKNLSEYKNIFNNYGGFLKNYVTEYGLSAFKDKSEQIQAKKLVQQSVLLDFNNVDLGIIYNFWNIGNDEQLASNNYGLVNNDYTPKLAYYAMKNYYENTNGAEYIGTLTNIEEITSENLEAHVYDKNGKPKITVWSNNSDVSITIPYKNFKATDLYGEEIQPDENGNLVITTSPIYLDDVDYNYFYLAISNVATEKYDEFTEKFASEIAQIPELTSKIEESKKYMESVAQVEDKIVGSATIQAMKNHFELGNIILQAYKDGKLQAEDVKVSSMLNMLNDIGDSYEDLVTVSAQAVEQSEIEQTKNLIQEAETTINNNQGCEIIYPVKILDFAKDYYEKSTYINSLEEENDIKAGLIISNNLHASLLADWAKTFAQINIDNYVDEYIANNPVTIEYSTTELTNQNVKATIKTNAEIQITNNSNSKEHTFEQNGTFTFEYTIKGQAFNILATVNNIDKVAPAISGVQKAKLYTKPVTPKISDENLQEVKLILNSQVVSNYKNGDTLEEEGFYELTATDKAGNVTSSYFQIFINTDKDYKIEDNYIKNVTNNTKKSDFDKKLNLSVNYTITRNGAEITESDIIATGDVLTTEVGDKYTIIVPGDINKDGLVNLKDFIELRIYLLLENGLDDIEMLAADCNNDNQPVGVKDYIRMRLIILMN